MHTNDIYSIRESVEKIHLPKNVFHFQVGVMTATNIIAIVHYKNHFPHITLTSRVTRVYGDALM